MDRIATPTAEQAVIGALLLEPSVLGTLGDLLDEHSFEDKRHRLIFRAMADCAARGEDIDVVTLAEQLERSSGASARLLGSYIVDLASTTPSAKNVRAYAEIVHERSQRRFLAEVGRRLEHAADAGDTAPLELAAHFRAELDRVGAHAPIPWLHAKGAARQAWESVTDRCGEEASHVGLTTGIPDLDELTGTLKPGQLIVVAGRPASGKSTLAFNIAEHIAFDLGQPALFNSLEMGAAQLGLRLLCSRARVSHRALTQAPLLLEDTDWARISQAIAAVQTSRLWLTEPRELTIPGLLAEARRARSDLDIKLLVIDYLGLLVLRKADRRDLAIGEATRALKLLAGELQIPIVLLSQLNRESDKRPDKRPQLSDLRDSGSIEQDADTVILCHRPQAHDPTSDAPAELIVAKRRDGATGTVYVRAALDFCRFDPLGPRRSDETDSPSRSARPVGGRRAPEMQLGPDN